MKIKLIYKSQNKAINFIYKLIFENDKKLKTAHYAIQRINEYNNFNGNLPYQTALLSMSPCSMCAKVKRKCNLCPFDLKSAKIPASGPIVNCRIDLYSNVSEHRRNLIRSTLIWLKKNLPHMAIEKLEVKK